VFKTIGAASLALLAGFAVPTAAPAQTVTAVLEAEVVTLDPHFTGAYISRTFGYAVFDTLYGMDSSGAIQPQMVEGHTVSPDGLTWTFRLREGLTWHDGQPVTAADCVASLKRWGPRAALGRRLLAATASLEPLDARSFELRLKEPFGLVLDALGRPNSPVPFMLPERLARTPGETRITDIVGSGPFMYSQAEHRTGDRMVLKRNPRYVPRAEPANFLAGSKAVHVEAVEFRVVPDGATAVNALQAGEVDFLQYIPFDLLPVLERNPRVKVQSFEGMHAFQGYFRLNHAAPPFNDPEIRRVLWRLIDQSTVLDALGLPDRHMVKGCRSFFMCGTPLETTVGAEIGENPSIEAARAALARTRYKGETIVVFQANDIDAPRVSSAVVADLLRQAGFKVDLQTMDWGTVLARRTKRDAWHLFGVHASGFDLSSPLTHFYIVNNCNDAPGWSCDPRLDPLLDAFSKAPDQAARKSIADRINAVAYELVPAVMWGQLVQPAAYRANLQNVIPSSIPVFWSLRK
jgi:peptide/nickel transport system substrate-binding protein